MVINMLDCADDVPAYLASAVFPADHRPRDLLPEIQALQQEQEEIKSMAVASIDYDSYLGKIPPDKKFLRFKTLPRDIVLQFVMKNLPFHMERDESFARNKKLSYKFAVEDFSDFGYLKRLLQQGGWQKFGPLYSQD